MKSNPSRLSTILIFWKFSRPHTIIGSVVSILTLYLLALKNTEYTNHLPLLMATLVVGISCNIFIVGLNQIIYVELDKLNKPDLPLASGVLSLQTANRIIRVCFGISLIGSFLLS